MAMNITKVTQLAGVRYLLNTVATGDRPSTAHGGMSAYYTAAGTPPGRWWGVGAETIGLGGGLPVTHAGAEALFSQFAHPLTGAPLGTQGVQLHAAREQVSAKAVSGFDLTFRIPKSVSVLWATAGEDVKAAILAAHHDAVEQALSWVQEEALCTRSGRGGAVSSPVVGMIAARFDHWDTREGDPHLHSHVVVANRVQRAADGKWMTVDGAGLYRSAVAASELHENLLLDVLHERLGLTFSERARTTTRATRSVVVDVDGIPADVIERFSSRAAQVEQVERELIEQWTNEHGGHAPSRRAMDSIHQKAWRATRQPKDKQVRPLGELVAGWREQLRSLGHDPRDLAAAALGHDRSIGSVDRVVADTPAIETFAHRLLDQLRGTTSPGPVGDEGLQEKAIAGVVSGVMNTRATWTRANLRAEAERMTRLVRCARGERGALLDAITDLALAQCTPLTPVRYALPDGAQNDPRVARTTTATGMDDPTAHRYTHARVLDAESYLRALATDPTEAAPRLHLERAQGVLDHLNSLNDTRPLAPDQAAAAVAVTCDPRRVTALVGPAGTGKTTTMAAVRACWEAEHGPGTVVGLATSARAAAELSASLEVQAHTVAKMLWETDSGGLAKRAERRQQGARLMAARSLRARAAGARLLTEADVDDVTYQLRPGQLVIVDEASMTGTFDLAQLARQVETAGAKMLLVGDPAQLDAPAAGGMLGWLDRTGAAAQLTSVWRFHEEWEADASLQLRAGDPSGLVAYEDNGRLREGGTEAMLEAAYTAVHTARQEGRTAILIAATNDQVADLNTRFTLDRRAAGDVDTTVLVPLRGGADAGVGEIVLAREVDGRIRDEVGVPIRNGDLLTVTATAPGGSALAVRNDNRGARIVLPEDYLAQSVELGYATTAHRAQGITVDEGHLAITYGEHMTRELLYVAMTRGRDSNVAWVGLPTAEDLRGEHQVISDMPTAFTVLSRALGTETAERTAHEVGVREHEDSHNLGRLVAEYEYLARWHNGPALHAHLRETIGQDQADRIASSFAWNSLVATYSRANAIDSRRTSRLLRLPVTPAGVDDEQATGRGTLFGPEVREGEVTDPAAVLQHRLAVAVVQDARVEVITPGWVVGQVPELHTQDPVLDDLAGQCAVLIADRVQHIAHEVHNDPPRWVSAFGPRPDAPTRARAWDDMAAAVAVYRDTYQVEGIAPLGPRPCGRDRRRDRDWQRVADRIETWDQPAKPAAAPADPWPDVDPFADADWIDAEILAVAWSPQLDELLWREAPGATATEPDLPERVDKPQGDAGAVDRIAAVNDAAWEIWQSRAVESWVPRHLSERRLHAEAGHAPAGWTTTLDTLRGRGFTDNALLEAGLASYASTGRLIDRFRDRLVLPIRDREDRIVAFTARANPDSRAHAALKYLNTPETLAYDKSAILYGLDSGARRRLADGATPVLVEGAIDVAAVRELGDPSLVPIAACGMSVTAAQLDDLRHVTGDGLGRLVVALDSDIAGARAAERIWTMLGPGEAATAQCAALPEGRDPADLIAMGEAGQLYESLTVATPLTHTVIDATARSADTTQVAGRVVLVRMVAQKLRRLPPDAAMAATDHLQVTIGDGLMASTIMDEVIDAYTPVPAGPPMTAPAAEQGAVRVEAPELEL